MCACVCVSLLRVLCMGETIQCRMYNIFYSIVFQLPIQYIELILQLLYSVSSSSHLVAFIYIISQYCLTLHCSLSFFFRPSNISISYHTQIHTQSTQHSFQQNRSYALVLSENHVYTSGAGGTNAAAIRGALRAERPDLLTVILPQSKDKQPDEIQELLSDVTDLVTMPQNDAMSLNVASRVCNSKLLSETDQLIAFAFHESKTVIEATKEAKKLEMLVTMLFLD